MYKYCSFKYELIGDKKIKRLKKDLWSPNIFSGGCG